MPAREVVEIVITEKGAKATSSAIKGVGRSGLTASKAIGVLAAGLAVIGGVRGFIGVTKGAINASAAFEGYGVRLGSLLGSQTEANKALDNFVDLSSRTPFAVSEIVEGASALGAAALGNRDRLEDLTQTAANLAAVTGLSFQDAAGNLQRSLQAGIGAADLFRERGVRALIESISGIPDATKASAEELEDAFSQVFGVGGTFGNAAENLSLTLGGALSNIGDAASNLNVALGNAFAPAVINTARQVIIPFLTALRGEVAANEQELGEFAAGAIQDALEGLLSLGQGALAVIQAFDQIGRGIGSSFNGLVGTILEVTLALQEAEVAFLTFTGAGTAEIAIASEGLSQLRGRIDQLAESEFRAGQETIEFERTLDGINDRIVSLQTSLRSADFSVDPRVEQADIDLSGAGGGDEAQTTEQLKAQQSAVNQIASTTERLRISEAARIEPLDGQLEKLRQQRDALQEAAVASGDVASAQEGLSILNAQIAATEAEKTAALERQTALQAEIASLVQQAALSSPTLAAEIQKAADAAIAAGGGLESVNDELAKVGENAKDGLDEARTEANAFGDTVSSELSRGIGSAVRGALSGEGVDAAALFADIAGRLVEDALTNALSSLSDGVGGLFGGGGAGAVAGGGGGFDFGALVGAGLTAGTAVLAGALKDTSSTISNNLVRSAAAQSSAAATRGVIAGPTSVPIFQVGAQLEAAFGPTNEILTDIAGSLEILVAAGAGVGGGSSAASDFDSTTPSLT
ncbi:MAG: hypothetical protein WBG86_06280 [Polyangiales bacterium]